MLVCKSNDWWILRNTHYATTTTTTHLSDLVICPSYCGKKWHSFHFALSKNSAYRIEIHKWRCGKRGRRFNNNKKKMAQLAKKLFGFVRKGFNLAKVVAWLSIKVFSFEINQEGHLKNGHTGKEALKLGNFLFLYCLSISDGQLLCVCVCFFKQTKMTFVMLNTSAMRWANFFAFYVAWLEHAPDGYF